jgi:tetratricopeptide (TPR) repeat protein/transcriptional regulator with XRE-family HTH domain
MSTLTFAALLRRFRRATGLTQAELAEHAGLSPEAVSALERGVNRAPRRETVDLLADALQLGEPERAQFEQAARRRPSVPDLSLSTVPAADQAAILVGRDHALGLIERALGMRAKPVLLFAGEPGVGKTRLLREAAALAAGGGWTVLFGTGSRASYHDPYAPLLGILERDIAGRSTLDLKKLLQGCGWLVRLLPELAERELVQFPAWTLPPDQERRLMFAAVARYLSNIGGSTGTLLVLDDLQSAGSDVCALLATLVRTPTATPLRLIGGYRNTDLSSGSPLGIVLTDLEHERLISQAILERLGVEESVTLLQSLLPADDAVGAPVGAEMRQRVARQCGGIPLYLVSWAQALASGALPMSEDAAALPWDVAQSIRQRIAMQGEITAEVLHVLAVAGGTAPLRLVRAVLLDGGRREDEIIAALEAGVRARLLEEGVNDSYQFTSDVLSAVVARDLSAARRITLHRRIAEALEREPGEPQAELLAFHYLRGDEPVKAVAHLERAGDRAVTMQAYAAAEASYAALVQRLESLGRPHDAARAREKWGRVLGALGRFDQALAALDRARGQYHGEDDAEAQMRVLAQIGQVYADQGAAREGLQRLAPAITADASGTPQGVSPRTLAALHDVYAQLLYLAGQYRGQLAESEQAAAFARDGGEQSLLCQIQIRRGSALRMLGRLGEASQTLEDVIRVAEAIGDPRILTQALENASVVYLLQGEFARSTRYVERALTLADPLADPLITELLLMRLGMNTFAAGDWTRAHDDYTHAQELQRQLGMSWVSAYIALGVGQLQMARGELAPGTDQLETGVALAEQVGDLQALRWAQTVLAERDLLAGKAEAAHARLVPLLDRPGEQEGVVTYLLPYLAWASLDLGRDEEAAEQLQECLTRATGEHIRLAQVEALRVRALAALRRGEIAEAEQALEDGLDIARAIPYPYAEAKLLYTGGLASQAIGDPKRARERLRQALAALKALGEGLYRPHVEQALLGLAK